jgi:hypothetical protein
MQERRHWPVCCYTMHTVKEQPAQQSVINSTFCTPRVVLLKGLLNVSV